MTSKIIHRISAFETQQYPVAILYQSRIGIDKFEITVQPINFTDIINYLPIRFYNCYSVVEACNGLFLRSRPIGFSLRGSVASLTNLSSRWYSMVRSYYDGQALGWPSLNEWQNQLKKIRVIVTGKKMQRRTDLKTPWSGECKLCMKNLYRIWLKFIRIWSLMF